MDELWQNIRQPVIEYAGRLPGAILIVLVGWLVMHFLVRPLRQVFQRSRLDPSVASFLANSLRGAVLIVVVLAFLYQLGVQTASLVTLLGAAGLAVALSLQNSLANFASGLLLLTFRRVRVGDQVEVGDLRGRVSEMLPFHTVLVTTDNQCIIVPNTMMTNGPVRNNSTLPLRRVQWTFSLKGSEPVDAIKRTLHDRLLADPRIRPEPPLQFYFQEWNADKCVLVVTAWTATVDYLTVQQELLEELGKSLAALKGAD
jgi:small conductance mechanosensitive channel